MRILKTKKSFRKEFKRQLKYAIAAAVGFLIAFSWREAVWDSTKGLVDKFSENLQFMTSAIFTALIITAVGVMIILLSAKLLKEK